MSSYQFTILTRKSAAAGTTANPSRQCGTSPFLAPELGVGVRVERPTRTEDLDPPLEIKRKISNSTLGTGIQEAQNIPGQRKEGAQRQPQVLTLIMRSREAGRQNHSHSMRNDRTEENVNT